MLAGLIFAIDEAEDAPGTLAATLPFGGTTLLEYQVRLLAGAGVERVMVAVGRMTPALVAAVGRAGRRGVAIEIVRSAEEASERVSPDASVVVMADGLVTTDPVIDRMAVQAGGEALLVTDDANAPAAIERLDMRDSWAGIARVRGATLAEIAHMPADYDFQSALLRVAAQAGAEHVPLTPEWQRSGHSVERGTQALAARSTTVLAALTERRTSWADRWIFTPLARLVVPQLTRRNVPGWSVLATGAALAAAALGLVGFGLDGAGVAVALLGVAALATSGAFAALVGEERYARWSELGITALALATVASAGASARVASGDWTPAVLGLAAVGCQALVERSPAAPRRWWASPSALLVLLAPFALARWTTAGLAVTAAYAFATLAAAVETSREKA